MATWVGVGFELISLRIKFVLIYLSGGLHDYLEAKLITVTYLDRQDNQPVPFQDNLISIKVEAFSIDHLSSPAGILRLVTPMKTQ